MLRRPVIPSNDLASYRIHSRVSQSYLPTRLLRRTTAYFQELRSLLDRTRFVRAGLGDISMITFAAPFFVL